MTYHAFMSYSNAADGNLAPALHSALHQFAKPWYRLRALHVFRDKTTLHPTPHLWHAIQSALDQSAHFILLASPEAAASPWVQREIDHWLKRNSIDRVLIVLTGGTAVWDRAACAFDATATTALPQSLLRAFADEPLHLDLRWAQGRGSLSLRDPLFQEAVADLAAALHGRPKDQIIGEDVRQHRRTRRLTWSVVAALSVLAASATVAALLAFQQRTVAETQRTAAVEQSRVALARQLAAQATSIRLQFPDQLQLAVLLALESTRLHPSFEGNQALRAALTLLPRPVEAYSYDVHAQGRVRALAFSRDGYHLAAARDEGTATLFDLRRPKTFKVLFPGETQATVIDLRSEEKRESQESNNRNEVISLAFSPDGAILATASNDGTARLWETASGREVLKVIHGSPVACIDFSPDGKHLATGTNDGKVRVFAFADVRQRLKQSELDADDTIPLVMESEHGQEVRQLRFNPDGSYLAAISTDGGVSLSKLEAREVERVWYTGASGLGLAFSHDGTKLATASGNYAFVWDATTGAQLFKGMHAKSAEEGLGHALWIDAVAFSSDGEHLATGGRDNTARMWSLASGQELFRVTHAAPVESVAFSPDGATLATGSFDGTARLWETSSARERLRATHWGGAEVVAFSPDGNMVASGGVDGSVNVWSLNAGDQLASIGHSSEVTSLCMSPNGRTMASAGNGGDLRAWSSGGRIELAAAEPVYGVRSLAFSEDGRFLVGAGRNPTLFMMNLKTGPEVKVLANAQDARDPIVRSHYTVATGNSRQIRVWETAGGRELDSIPAIHLDRFRLDPTGRFLAIKQTGARHGENGVIRLRDLAQSEEIGELPVSQFCGRAFALSPGGRLLGLSIGEPNERLRTTEHHVEVWDVSARQCVARIPQADTVAFIDFDPSGKLLLTVAGNFADQQTRIEVWDWAAQVLRTQLEHRDRISRIEYGGASTVLATISAGRAQIWDYSTGALLSQLSDGGTMREITFSRDGRYVMTGGSDGTATVWWWKTEDLQDEACKRLTRNLSSSEWRQYLGNLPYRPTCPNLPQG